MRRLPLTASLRDSVPGTTPADAPEGTVTGP